MNNKNITVVVPLFNEEGSISELWNRLLAVLESVKCGWNIVFVDDGSRDHTREAVEAICQKDQRVKLIALSRNFGHQGALSAGIDHAGGDAVILMDGDLQDKPEAIPQFIEAWQSGAEVAYAVRSSRQEPFLKRILFDLFYRMLAGMSGIKQPLNAGIFGLIDRRVLDVIRDMGEHNRYFPGLRAYAGFKQVGVKVDRDARFAGKPRVGLKGLIKLAFDAIFSFSLVPIRLATMTGVLVAMGSFLYLLFVLYHKLITGQAIPGWTSILGAVLFIGGLQLIMLGIVGEYIGRIYEETKKRPQYVVSEKINF